MNRWLNRIAVVTGASSGIGARIAKDLIKSKVSVVGLARRIEKMEEIQSKLPQELQSKFYPLKCDITNENQVENSFNWINKNLGGVDILINNAGIVRPGNLVDMNINEIHDVINTNVMGIIYCTQNAFKSMKDRKVDGHVILINSIAGKSILNIKGNSLNIYTVSKFGVTVMTEMYRNEFFDLGTNVKITSINPGAVDTEIIQDELKNTGIPFLKPENISDAVLYVLGTPPNVQIKDLTIKPVGEQF